jgi:hypothetical protein
MKITAAEVKKGNADLRKLGKEIEARIKKLDHYAGQAVDFKDSINKLLEDARKLCADEKAFAEFKKRHCPLLGKSRAYELLQIEQGKKTVEQIRAATRKRVADHRARAAEKENNCNGKYSSVTPEPSHDSDLSDSANDETHAPAPTSDVGADRQPEERTSAEVRVNYYWPSVLDDTVAKLLDLRTRAFEQFVEYCHHDPDDVAAAADFLCRVADGVRAYDRKQQAEEAPGETSNIDVGASAEAMQEKFACTETEEPVKKRGRGRPPGSRNRPKAEEATS